MTLVRIAIFRPDGTGVDVPAKGQLYWAPSMRRHVEDPTDHIVLPAPFKVVLGDDYLDEDGNVVTEGEPGVAWVEVDPTGPDWAWTVVERINKGRGTTWVTVVDLPQVEYADLPAVDPDTLDPDVDPEAAWWTYAGGLDTRITILEAGTAALPPGGSTGEVLTKLSNTDQDADWEPAPGGATGGAGGVLSGSYPNPGFAVDMAEQAELNAHTSNTSNPHSVTKAQVGLGSADNTADTAKPVSTAQQAALDLKANIASPTFTGTVGGITKSMVGLGNVDNTADTAKPVSTAQQTALNLKADLASPALTGNPTAPTPTAGDNDTSIATTAYATAADTVVSLGAARPLLAREPRPTDTTVLTSGTLVSQNGGTDSSDPLISANGPYAQTAGAGAGNSARLDNLVIPNLTGKGVWIPLKVVSNGAKLSHLYISLGVTSSHANSYQIDYPTGLNGKTTLFDGVWTSLFIPFSQFVNGTINGAPTPSTLTSVKIIAQDNNTGTGVRVLMDANVGFYTEPEYGTISVSCDDTYIAGLDACKKMAAYGWRPMLFPIVSRLDTGSYLTTAQLRRCHDTFGAEIGVHCMNDADHVTLVGQSAATIRAKYAALRDWQRSLGFTSSAMAFPNGNFDSSVVSVVGEFYNYQRTNDNLIGAGKMYGGPVASSVVLASTVTLAAAKLKVDAVAAHNGNVHFLVHELVGAAPTGNQWLLSDFNDLIDYAAAQGLKNAMPADLVTKVDIASSSGGVTSVNGDSGPVVVLDADDFADGVTNHVFTAADDTKLGGIEALADVTDAANVAAAGAYMAGGTDVAVADGGTGRSTATTAYGLIAAGTTASGVQQTITPGTSGHLLKSNGASALASFSAGVKGDVGLGNVDNTADTAKPVSTAQQTALDLKANLASPALTGNPTAPTPAAADNDTSIATTAFVQGEIAAKAPLASPVFTGNPTAPTPSVGDNDTSVATTAYATAADTVTLDKATWGSISLVGVAGRYTVLTSPNNALTGSTTNNVLRLIPVYIGHAFSVDRIGIGVTGAGEAGSTIRLAVYDNDNGIPGNPVIDQSVAGSAIATVEATISYTFAIGWYHVGGVIQNAPTTQPTIRTTGTVWNGGLPLSWSSGANASAGAHIGNIKSPVSGALPAWGATGPDPTGVAPRVHFRYA